MTAQTLARELAVVPLEDIDPPVTDARLDRDPEKLEELARDMQAHGQIEPIKLVRVGARLEIVDGFTRYLAAKSVAMPTLEAFIYPSKLAAVASIKYRANVHRLEMSAADEAMYFYKLYSEECGEDIEKVAALVGRKVPYVDQRLELINGDDLVFHALREKSIAIGVARELNKITDPVYIRYYLKHAIEGGATVSTVTGWVQQWKALGGGIQLPATNQTDAGYVAPPNAYDPNRCHVCNKSIPGRMTQTIYVHGSCLEAILEPMLQAARGGSDDDNELQNPQRA